MPLKKTLDRINKKHAINFNIIKKTKNFHVMMQEGEVKLYPHDPKLAKGNDDESDDDELIFGVLKKRPNSSVGTILNKFSFLFANKNPYMDDYQRR